LGLAKYPESREAIMVGYAAPPLAILQTPLLLALRMAGYRVHVLLGSAATASARFYRAFGAAEILESEVIPVRADNVSSEQMLASVRTSDELLGLAEGGISVGRFAVSTLMRRLRVGRFGPADPEIHAALVEALTASRQAAERARHLISLVKPSLVCFYDRGYTPDGELFDAALASGARATTWNAAHRGGSLLSKRYGNHNRDVHPGMPSRAFWSQLKEMPWTSSHWDALRGELEECYRDGLWYDAVGTQTNKRIIDRDKLVADLGLDPDKPTAVIFPHIFWDASFFWGKDLFSDYREWFIEVIRAAVKNTSLNWIVKVHPANLVKNRRENYVGEFSEVVALRDAVKELPPHVKFMPPDTPVSTFSLFSLMDYCLTVRGTVGLEAAIFGKTVLTAGTGRYDGFGFTVDSSSREEYLDRLSRLTTIPAPTEAQTELARRYSYGLFMQRPLKAKCMRFGFAKDASATLNAELTLSGGSKLEEFEDLRLLSAWLGNPDSDDLVGNPNSV
jgi:hypothetical protein